jgi:membrane protease YdiL (CAAX protease family)
MTEEMNLVLSKISDGVIKIGNGGSLIFFNQSAGKILNLAEKDLNAPFLASALRNPNNDEFVQAILNAVYSKGETVALTQCPYIEGENRHILELTSVYIRDKEEMTIVFSDVTEREKMKKKQRNASLTTITYFIYIYICIFLYVALNYFFPGKISPDTHAIIFEVVAAFILAFLIFSIQLKPDIYILKPKNVWPFIQGLLIGVGGFVLFCLIKVMLQHFGFLRTGPFLNWSNIDIGFYPLTVIYQEFMSRQILQDSLSKAYAGKHQDLFGVLVSSLIFSLLHISFGFVLMMASFILLSVFGAYYAKTKNFWGLCIIHLSGQRACSF